MTNNLNYIPISIENEFVDFSTFPNKNIYPYTFDINRNEENEK
jgi:hypothetical protein